MRCETVFAIASLVLAAAGCSAPDDLPPEGHLLVRLDTDAVLPSSSDSTAGVFDSVFLELVDGDGQPACADCAREIGITHEAIQSGATFVVRAARSAILRARLFDSRLGVASRDEAVVVEHWVRLPAAPPEGARPIGVTLPMERVGQPLGSLSRPTEPDDPDSRLAPLPAEVVLDGGGPGEICVPGGFFWLGDPRLPSEASAPSPGDMLERSANVPRLVHIESFCVDAHEVTVAELRASGVATDDVPVWSGTTDTSNLASFCPFTRGRGPNEERAVSCVSWTTARAMCQSRGMDLPTEAQLEYLGTAFGRSSFVWGHDAPACSEALFARAVPPLSGDGSCRRGEKTPFLPATSATLAETRDVLVTPGGTITGLASNLSEWTREEFASSTATCRGSAVGITLDPECPATGTTTRVAVRGGNLASTPAECAAALRAYVTLPKLRPDLGFRCVR